MGPQSTDLLAELQEDSDACQARLVDVFHELVPNAQSGGEAKDINEIKEPHDIGGKELATKIEEAPLEGIEMKNDVKKTQQLSTAVAGDEVPTAEATPVSGPMHAAEAHHVQKTKVAHTDIWHSKLLRRNYFSTQKHGQQIRQQKSLRTNQLEVLISGQECRARE